MLPLPRPWSCFDAQSALKRLKKKKVQLIITPLFYCKQSTEEYLVRVDSLYPFGTALLGNFREGQVLCLLEHSLGRRNKVFFWGYRWNHKVFLQELLRGPWAQSEPVEFPPGVATWSRFHWKWGILWILALLPALHLNHCNSSHRCDAAGAACPNPPFPAFFWDGVGQGGSHSLPTLPGAQHPHQKYLCFAEGGKTIEVLLSRQEGGSVGTAIPTRRATQPCLSDETKPFFSL